MTPRKVKLLLAAAAGAALFALSHFPPLAEVVTLFDGGQGAGAVLFAPGAAAVPPSWVFRYGCLVAGALALAPLVPALGRAALQAAAFVRRRLGDWWVVGLVGLASALASAFLGHLSLGGEGHTWGERELLFQARIIASGHLTAAAPATEDAGPDFLVGPEEGLREGRWFSIFPPVAPALLAVGEALGRPGLVNAALGLLTAFVLFGWGRRLVGDDVALLATLLYAASPFVLFANASFQAQPAFLLLLLLFMWTGEEALRTGEAGAAVLAGVMLAALFGTQPYASLAAAIPAVGLALYLARRGRGRRPLPYLAAGLAAGALALLAYNYATTGAPLRFPWAYGENRILGVPVPGLSPALILLTTRRLWTLATDLHGWPLLSLLPALAPLCLKKLPSALRFSYAVAALTLVLFLLPHAEGIPYGAAAYYGLLPAALLGGAYGLTLLPEWLRGKWGFPAGTAAAAVVLAVAAGTAPYLASVEPIYRHYWGFPEGKKPWVTPQLGAALEEWQVWEAIIFVAPEERCGGPPPNDAALENRIIYARDRGERNEAFAAHFPPRPYLLCDYREFERTGVLRVLELEPAAAEGGP
ncbi:MAG: glycosyltransferase family 39 protein [Candidatus Coatesbacteria bacterium]|nr:MAG: glycosyltransferase family 39 protein [Candidatus Coatesbacteria bacterium]